MSEKCKNLYYVPLMIMLFMNMSGTIYGQGSNPRELLSQFVLELQKSPDDRALREKIIKHVQMMKQKPAIPKEVERFMARGQAAMETAKEPDDFKVAATEFVKATLAAPWLGNAYYNLGIVQDKAGDYPAAIRNLQLYLLATPNASDTKAVETLIYKIEFKQEVAAKDKDLAVKKAMEQRRKETAPKDLSGIWRTYYDNNESDEVSHYRIQQNGNEVLGFTVWDKNYGGELKGSERLEFQAKLQDRILTGKYAIWASKPFILEGFVAEEFREINFKSTTSSGEYVSTWSMRRE